MRFLVEFKNGRLYQTFAGSRATAVRQALKYTGYSKKHLKSVYTF